MLSTDRDYLLKWLFSKISCKSALGHRLLKYFGGRALVSVFSKYWLLIAVYQCYYGTLSCCVQTILAVAVVPPPLHCSGAQLEAAPGPGHTHHHTGDRGPVAPQGTWQGTGGGADDSLVTCYRWHVTSPGPGSSWLCRLPTRGEHLVLNLQQNHTHYTHRLYQLKNF